VEISQFISHSQHRLSYCCQGSNLKVSVCICGNVGQQFHGTRSVIMCFS